MDVREKLVDVFDDIGCEKLEKAAYSQPDYEQLISDLIAHGVTVQQWISSKDGLPTIYDADADNCVLAIHKASNKRYYHWRSVADNPFDFTYWTRTPQPPKGE